MREFFAYRKVKIFSLLITIIAYFSGSFLVFRKNRVLEGIGKTAASIFGQDLTAIFLGFVFGVLLFDFYRAIVGRSTGKNLLLIFIEIIAALVVFGLILVSTGNQAYLYDREFGHLTRTSPGFSFWLFLLGLYLFGIETAKETGISATSRIVSLCYFMIVIGLFYLGVFQYVSIYKEYMNNRAIFIQEIRRHLFLSLGSVIAALVVGIPLGIWSARREGAYRAIFAVLNVLQTLPTLSFIGLLMIPLGYIGEKFEFAKMLNIRAVGWAPAFIVLTSYAIYPIARNTYAALKALRDDYLEVATSLGLGKVYVFFKIELPLIIPVLLAGLKVSLVQTSAGTILAALVGAGGLGIFIFLGLAQTAQDLVLLGLIPIIALSFVYSFLVDSVEALFNRGGVVDDQAGWSY